MLVDCLSENILPFFLFLAATKNLEAKNLKGFLSIPELYLCMCFPPPLVCFCEILAEKSK